MLNKIPVQGYPFSGSVKRQQWLGDLTGNNNYQQAGDVIYARDFGMGGFETFNTEFGGYSNSGTYFVRASPATTASNYAETFAPVYNNVTVHWYYAANSAEVANNANMSAEVVRISARGV
jgi:hypothetical protein